MALKLSEAIERNLSNTLPCIGLYFTYSAQAEPQFSACVLGCALLNYPEVINDFLVNKEEVLSKFLLETWPWLKTHLMNLPEVFHNLPCGCKSFWIEKDSNLRSLAVDAKFISCVGGRRYVENRRIIDILVHLNDHKGFTREETLVYIKTLEDYFEQNKSSNN